MEDKVIPTTADNAQNTLLSQSEPKRYFYMDNLRAIAMFAGIVFHAMLAYSLYLHEGWPTADTSSSVYIDVVAWLLHMFRMPVFFLISGFFACYLVRKRGNLQFFKNRLMRIALPFIIFWPLAVIAVVGSFIYAASHTTVDTPIISFLRFGMENPDQANQQKPPLTSMHLWFLYYLFFFCLATVSFNRFISLSEKVKDFLIKPICLLGIMPLLTSVAFFQLHLPHAAPESFKPALWPFLYYGSFFFIGWVFYQKQHMLDMLKPWAMLMSLIAIAAYATFWYLTPREITIVELMAKTATLPVLDTKQVALSLCTSILSWYLTLLSLVAAIKFLNINSKKIRYIADSSYWLYILHIPLLFALQIYFHTIHWPIIVELTLSIVITFTIGLLTYALLIRPTPIGWMLNGRKNIRTKRKTELKGANINIPEQNITV